MPEIDPQEFGRLQGQVEQLIRSNEVLTETVSTMATAITAMQLQLAKAEGGWKVLVALGGMAGALGSGLTWLASNWPWKGGTP
jgi:prefoldin subunit 5